MEARLSEALAHRFQASGKVAVFLTREWRNLRSGPNFMVKIKDCSPDELTPSSFVRFSIWDQGKELGSFAEPVRMAHYVEVFYSKGTACSRNATQFIGSFFSPCRYPQAACRFGSRPIELGRLPTECEHQGKRSSQVEQPVRK